MKKLQSLMLKTLKNETISLKSWQTSRVTLKRLCLVGKLDSMPQSIEPSLKNLVKIELVRSQLQNDPLDTLEKLLNLVHIRMDNSYTGKSLRFKSEKFLLLKVLRLYNFNSLSDVSIDNRAMPDLCELSIRKCTQLTNIPSGINNLLKLNTLSFYGVSPELADSIKPPPDQGTKYEEVSHVPQLMVVVAS